MHNASYRFLALCWPYIQKRKFWIVCVFLVLELSATLLIPQIAKSLFNSTLNVASVVTLLLIWYSLLCFFEASSQYMLDIVFFPVINDLIRTLTSRLCCHINQMPYMTVTALSVSELLSSIKRIPQSVRFFFQYIFQVIAPNFIKLVLSFFILYRINLISAFLFLGVALGFVGIMIALAYYSYQRQKSWTQTDQSAKVIGDYLEHPDLAKFFPQAMEAHLDQQLKREADQWYVTNVALNVFYLSQETLILIFMCSVLFTGLWLIQSHVLSVGDFILIQGYLMAFIVPMRLLGQSLLYIQEATVDMEKVLALFKQTTESRTLSPEPEHEFMALHNVGVAGFLESMNALVAPGDYIVLSGDSGSGKSTFARLMAGLQRPDTGVVKVLGRTIADANLSDLAQDIMYIPQEPLVFHESIAFHLQLGINGDIQTALEQVELAHLQSQLHEDMSCLSGGEKQRIFLARAFLLRPKILILDETTSALPMCLEDKILHRLRDITQVMLVISHRLHKPEWATRTWTIQNKQLIL